MRILAVLFAGIAVSSTAAAQPYLNGGLVYIAGGSGGANSGGGYEFDSFVTGNADLRINGFSQIPIQLVPGDNVLTIQVDGGFGFPSPCGLGLFFTDDSTLLNTFGLAPSLVTYQANGSFAIASAGASVPTLGVLSPETPYSGATSFDSGLFSVTVKDFQFSGLNGTLTLNVATIPTPGAAGVIGLGLLGGVRRRRR